MDITIIPYPEVEQYSSHYAEEADVPEYPLDEEIIHRIIKARIYKLSDDKIDELQEYVVELNGLHQDLESAYETIVVQQNSLTQIKEIENKKYILSVVGTEKRNEHSYLTEILFQSEITNKPIILPEIVNVLTDLKRKDD